MSSIRVNQITDAAGGNSAVLNGVVNAPGSMSFRNRVINGSMVVDQRNTGASVALTGSTLFPVDRFPSIKQTSAATLTAQRSTVAPTGFTNSLLYTASTGASPAAGEINAVWHLLEGFNVADFGWGTASAQAVTLSFNVRASVTGTYSVAFSNGAANRFYLATYTVNAANTFEYKTITIPGDTTGTWLTDNGAGLQVTWDLGCGSNFNGTAGAWGATSIRRTSGSVQLIATSGATWAVTGAQLEAGTVATPFERRDFGRELMMCQRYTTRLGFMRQDQYNGSTSSDTFISYLLPVQMRAAPGVTVTGQITSLTGVGYTNTNSTTFVVYASGGNSGDTNWAVDSALLQAEL